MRKHLYKIVIALVLLAALLTGGWFWYQYQQQSAVNKVESVQGIVDIQSWTTQSGTEVNFVASTYLPMLDIEIRFDAGSARDGEQYGLSQCVAMMLDKGTSHYTANEIALGFEDVGATFSVESARDYLSIHVRTLTSSDVLDKVIALVNSICLEPNFNEKSFKIVKKQMLHGIKARAQSPNALAVNAFYKKLYGTHPYAHPIAGEAKTVAALAPLKCAQFHQSFFVANNATMTFVGDLSSRQAKKISKKILNNLPVGKAAPKLPALNKLAPSDPFKLTFPSNQSHILFGQPALAYHDPDFPSMLIGNYILGGGMFSSRIFKEVRIKKGLSYSAYSRFRRLKLPGPFYLAAQTNQKGTQQVIKLFKQILDEFVEEGPTQEEVASSKQYALNAFPVSLSSNSAITEVISTMGFYRQPLDTLDTFEARVRAVTKESIQAAFKKHLNLNTLQLVVVGEAS